MGGLFRECGPKIFSRGRNKTKLHLASKQVFRDGALLRLVEGEAELLRRSFIFDSYHVSPLVPVLRASNRPGSPSCRRLMRPLCRSDPRTSTGRAASPETTSTAPRSKRTALVGYWQMLIQMLIRATRAGAVPFCYSSVYLACFFLKKPRLSQLGM